MKKIHWPNKGAFGINNILLDFPKRFIFFIAVNKVITTYPETLGLFGFDGP